MEERKFKKFLSLNTEDSIWEHFYTISPLVIIGSKEGETYDLAPKHMATPIGYSNYFGFVCTPRHRTYQNIKKEKKFSVSFVRPDQILLTSLAALPRCDEKHSSKTIVDDLPTIPTSNNDNLFIADSCVLFDCSLFKIIDGFGECSIITGKIEEVFVHKDYKIYQEEDQQEHIYNNPLLAYVARGRFANIKETYCFPFPKDFST
ncbi:MAG: flavin reductase [Bacteroidota bacterium]